MQPMIAQPRLRPVYTCNQTSETPLMMLRPGGPLAFRQLTNATPEDWNQRGPIRAVLGAEGMT
eukprot:3670697-Pyramimonas_sp.AAC.1